VIDPSHLPLRLAVDVVGVKQAKPDRAHLPTYTLMQLGFYHIRFL
jgi:hypothetical protein